MAARNTFAATRRSHAILKRLRNGEGVTIRDVSENYDIQYPQARADLKLLEELYDLETYRKGRIKVWEMKGVNTIESTIGTAAALELGGIALDIFKHTPHGKAIDELTDQWRQRVGRPYSEHLKRLSLALVLRRTWLPMDSEPLLASLEEILDCIMLRRGVEIEYERSDGEVGTYLLIPRRLIWYQGRLWLQAVEDDQEKLFDVAGIRTAEYVDRDVLIESYIVEELQSAGDEVNEEDEALAQREAITGEMTARVNQWFEYKSRQEEDAYFTNAFGIFASNFEPEIVEVVVNGSWANYFRRYRLHPSQTIEEGEQGLVVRFEIGICPEFKSFLLGMIPDVQILGPEALRQELADRVQAYNLGG